MRIHVSLQRDLWKEIIEAAVYLFKRKLRQAQGWKTRFEAFHGKKAAPGSIQSPSWST